MSPSRKYLCLTVAASVVLFPPTCSIPRYSNSKLPSQDYALTNSQPPLGYRHHNFHPARSISHAYRDNVPKKIRHAIRDTLRGTVNDLEILAHAVRHPKQARWRWEK